MHWPANMPFGANFAAWAVKVYVHMVSSQDYRPFLGTLHIRGRLSINGFLLGDTSRALKTLR